jgi:AcrR family transcriptional regulator
MSQDKSDDTKRWSLPVKQKRAGETRDRLLTAGFKLLRRKRFEELSVADIARAAGCSVGVFYVRFVDKEQFFLALAEQFRALARTKLATVYVESTPSSLIGDAIKREFGIVDEYVNLWRAALRKSASDPDFWQEFRELGRHATDVFIANYERLFDRKLDEQETEQVRFAFQIVRSTVNNTALNQPGPLQLDEPEFRRQIERAFRLVAGVS